MIDLLICEDQPMVLRGLQKLIRSFDLPIGEIYLAENGDRAMELFQSHDIHMVVTDIRMPGCTGLELLSKMKPLQSDLQAVILSAYDDFSYAKTAIALGVEAYLLKPVDSGELLEALTHCLENLTRNVSRKQILSGILHDQIREVWGPELSETASSLLLSADDDLFHSSSFALLTFYQGETSASETTREQVRAFLSGFFARYLVFPVFACSFCAIINLSQKDAENLPSFLSDLKEFLRNYQKQGLFPLFCGISSIGNSVFHLKDLALEAEASLYRRFSSRGALLFSSESGVCPSAVKSGIMAAAGALCSDLRLPEAAAVEKDLTAMLALSSKAPEAVAALPDSLRQIDTFIRTELQEEWDGLSLLKAADRSDSLESLQKLLDQILTELCRKRLEQKWAKRDAVTQAIEYMEKNYRKPISLTVLANVVSLNYTYFSSIFKSRTGVSVTAYLQDLRIRKAKEMLISSDARVCDVAHKTGFADERYFEKLFKRCEGITPTEYRNRGVQNDR